MANLLQGQRYEDVFADMSTLMASSRPFQRLSRDCTTLGSLHSTRSSRIEKPRSTNNSPRTMDRRKNTSAIRTYSLPLNNATYVPLYDGTQLHSDYARALAQTARPVTWHPDARFSGTFLQSPDSIRLENQFFYQSSSPPSMDGHLDMMVNVPYSYGTGIPSTTYDQQLDPTDQDTPYDSPVDDNAFRPQLDAATSMYASGYSISPANTSWYVPDWPASSHRHSQMQYPFLHSQQDFLPIQHPPELEEEEDDVPQTPPSINLEPSDSKEPELIGMGLYDPPATPPHPFMSALNQGKGLKLEESWEPPPSYDDEEDAEDDGIELEKSGQNQSTVVDSLPVAAQNVARQIQSQAQWPVTLQVQMATGEGLIQNNMHGQTFFFEEGDGMDGEWWYEQLRNPAAKIRTQGIGHGWLGT